MTTSNPFAADGPNVPAEAGGMEPIGSGRHDAEGGISAGARIRAPIDPERDLECCRLPLTDLGNAERWRVRFGADFRFCAELGWFAWDGKRWELLSEEKDRLPPEVMQSVFVTVRAIRNEAALVAASGYPTEHLSPVEEAQLAAWAEAHGATSRELYLSGDADGSRARWIEEREPMDIVLGKGVLWSHKIAAWAKTSEGSGKMMAVGGLAKVFRDIAVRHDAFDVDPWAINVQNGTLRLVRKAEKRPAAEIEAGKSEWRTGGWQVRLEPHRREDMLTKIAPVPWNRRAKCPNYDAFLERVQPEPVMRRFIHQWGGYSLTGDTGEHKLAFFYGGGRNGKGTWVESVAWLAGDYAGSVGIDTFLDSGGKRRGDQATPDLAKLPGVRFLRVSEPEKGSAFNDGLIKQVTGGDPLDARHLNKGFFTFKPSFKMTVSGNNKPKTRDDSHGFWARMQLVPWSVEIPEAEIDRELGDKLRAEASGILNRLIDGLIDYKNNGLIVPDEVRAATRSYRESSDDLGRFLATICEVGDSDAIRCPSKELHELYQAWAEAAGGATMHIKGFKTAMENKGFAQKQSDGMKWIRVRPRAGVYLEAVKRGEWPETASPAAGPPPPAGLPDEPSGVDSSAAYGPSGGPGDDGDDWGGIDD